MSRLYFKCGIGSFESVMALNLAAHMATGLETDNVRYGLRHTFESFVLYRIAINGFNTFIKVLKR